MEYIDEIDSLYTLGMRSESLLVRFNSDDLDKVDSKIIAEMTELLCQKIEEFCEDPQLPKGLVKFLDFFVESRLCPQSKQDHLREILTKAREYSSVKTPPKEPVKVIKLEKAMDTIDMILPKDQEAKERSRPNVGQAIIDLNGEIIWADQNSQDLFEIDFKKDGPVNIFKDIMITMSSKYLKQRFNGNSVFKRKRKVGTKCSFTYAVYSKKAMKNYIYEMKKIPIRQREKVISRKIESQDKNGIFFRYLKTLKSKVTIIPLIYDKFGLKVLSLTPDLNICLTNSMKRFFKMKASDEISDDSLNISMTSLKIDAEVSVISEPEENVFQMGILLETEYADCIPCLPYTKMLNDPKIVEMRQYVRRALGLNEAEDPEDS